MPSNILDITRKFVPELGDVSDADLTLKLGEKVPELLDFDPDFKNRYQLVARQHNAALAPVGQVEAPDEDAGFFEKAGFQGGRAVGSFFNTAGSLPGQLGMSATRFFLGDDAEQTRFFNWLKEGQEERDVTFGKGDSVGDLVGSGVSTGVTLVGGGFGMARGAAGLLNVLGRSAAASATAARVGGTLNTVIQAVGQTFNNEYEQARSEGASEEEAWLQANSASAIESLGDHLLGGAGRFAKQLGLAAARKAGAKVAAKTAGQETAEDILKEGAMKQFFQSSVTEGIQESITGAGADLSANLLAKAFGREASRDPLDWGNRIADFIGGAAAGPVFGAARRSQAKQEVAKRRVLSPTAWDYNRADLLDRLDEELGQKVLDVSGGQLPAKADGNLDIEAVGKLVESGKVKTTPEVERVIAAWGRPELFNVRVDTTLDPPVPATPVQPAAAQPAVPAQPVPPTVQQASQVPAAPTVSRVDVLDQALEAEPSPSAETISAPSKLTEERAPRGGRTEKSVVKLLTDRGVDEAVARDVYTRVGLREESESMEDYNDRVLAVHEMVARNTPAAVPTKAEAETGQPSVETSGDISRIGEAGAAISENFYEGYLKTLKGESTTFQIEPSFSEAKEAFERGDITDAGSLKTWLEAWQTPRKPSTVRLEIDPETGQPTGRSFVVPDEPTPTEPTPTEPTPTEPLELLDDGMSFTVPANKIPFKLGDHAFPVQTTEQLQRTVKKGLESHKTVVPNAFLSGKAFSDSPMTLIFPKGSLNLTDEDIETNTAQTGPKTVDAPYVLLIDYEALDINTEDLTVDDIKAKIQALDTSLPDSEYYPQYDALAALYEKAKANGGKLPIVTPVKAAEKLMGQTRFKGVKVFLYRKDSKGRISSIWKKPSGIKSDPVSKGDILSDFIEGNLNKVSPPDVVRKKVGEAAWSELKSAYEGYYRLFPDGFPSFWAKYIFSKSEHTTLPDRVADNYNTKYPDMDPDTFWGLVHRAIEGRKADKEAAANERRLIADMVRAVKRWDKGVAPPGIPVKGSSLQAGDTVTVDGNLVRVTEVSETGVTFDGGSALLDQSMGLGDYIYVDAVDLQGRSMPAPTETLKPETDVFLDEDADTVDFSPEEEAELDVSFLDEEDLPSTEEAAKVEDDEPGTVLERTAEPAESGADPLTTTFDAGGQGQFIGGEPATGLSEEPVRRPRDEAERTGVVRSESRPRGLLREGTDLLGDPLPTDEETQASSEGGRPIQLPSASESDAVENRGLGLRLRQTIEGLDPSLHEILPGLEGYEARVLQQAQEAARKTREFGGTPIDVEVAYGEVFSSATVGLRALEEFLPVFAKAASDTAAPLQLQLHHDPHSFGLAASLDGATVLVDPITLGDSLSIRDAVTPFQASGDPVLRRAASLEAVDGMKALVEEEYIHLATIRALKVRHAKEMEAERQATTLTGGQSYSPMDFDSWVLRFSNEVLSDMGQTSKLRGLVEELYPGEDAYLGLEVVRMYLQYIRSTAGTEVIVPERERTARAETSEHIARRRAAETEVDARRAARAQTPLQEAVQEAGTSEVSIPSYLNVAASTMEAGMLRAFQTLEVRLRQRKRGMKLDGKVEFGGETFKKGYKVDDAFIRKLVAAARYGVKSLDPEIDEFVDKFRSTLASLDAQWKADVADQGPDPTADALTTPHIIHGTSSFEEAASILQGIRSGTNLTLDSTKENQTWGLPVVLAFEAGSIPNNPKGYQGNEGVTSREVAANEIKLREVIVNAAFFPEVEEMSDEVRSRIAEEQEGATKEVTDESEAVRGALKDLRQRLESAVEVREVDGMYTVYDRESGEPMSSQFGEGVAAYKKHRGADRMLQPLDAPNTRLPYSDDSDIQERLITRHRTDHPLQQEIADLEVEEHRLSKRLDALFAYLDAPDAVAKTSEQVIKDALEGIPSDIPVYVYDSESDLMTDSESETPQGLKQVSGPVSGGLPAVAEPLPEEIQSKLTAVPNHLEKAIAETYGASEETITEREEREESELRKDLRQREAEIRAVLSEAEEADFELKEGAPDEARRKRERTQKSTVVFTEEFTRSLESTYRIANELRKAFQHGGILMRFLHSVAGNKSKLPLYQSIAEDVRKFIESERNKAPVVSGHSVESRLERINKMDSDVELALRDELPLNVINDPSRWPEKLSKAYDVYTMVFSTPALRGRVAGKLAESGINDPVAIEQANERALNSIQKRVSTLLRAKIPFSEIFASAGGVSIQGAIVLAANEVINKRNETGRSLSAESIQQRQEDMGDAADPQDTVSQHALADEFEARGEASEDVIRETFTLMENVANGFEEDLSSTLSKAFLRLFKGTPWGEFRSTRDFLQHIDPLLDPDTTPLTKKDSKGRTIRLSRADISDMQQALKAFMDYGPVEEAFRDLMRDEMSRQTGAIHERAGDTLPEDPGAGLTRGMRSSPATPTLKYDSTVVRDVENVWGSEAPQDWLRSPEGTHSTVEKLFRDYLVKKEAGLTEPHDYRETVRYLLDSMPEHVRNTPVRFTFAESLGTGYYEEGVITLARSGYDGHVLVHETVHALLTPVVSAAIPVLDFITRGEAKAELLEETIKSEGIDRDVADLARLYVHVADRLVVSDMVFSDMTEAAQVRSGLPYGMLSLHEFLAEALSSPNFQKLLSNIPAPKSFSGKVKSVWDALVDLVRRVAGVPAKRSDALTAALHVADRLIQKTSRPEQQDLALVTSSLELFKDTVPPGKDAWDYKTPILDDESSDPVLQEWAMKAVSSSDPIWGNGFTVEVLSHILSNGTLLDIAVVTDSKTGESRVTNRRHGHGGNPFTAMKRVLAKWFDDNPEKDAISVSEGYLDEARFRAHRSPRNHADAATLKDIVVTRAMFQHASPNRAPAQVKAELERTRVAELGREELEAHRGLASRSQQRLYERKDYRMANAMLRQVRDYANRQRAVRGQKPLASTDPELLNYASALEGTRVTGNIPSQIEAAQDLVRSERAANRIADLTSKVTEALEAQGRLALAQADTPHRLWAADRVTRLRKRLSRAAKRADQRTVDRAREIAAFDQEFVEIESSRRTLLNPRIKSVFGSPLDEADFLKSAFGIELDQLAELQKDLSIELTAGSSEADRTRKHRARVRLGFLQNQLNHFRLQRRKLEADRTRVQANALPRLEKAQKEAVNLQVTSDEVEKYIEDILAREKGRVGTGSFLPDAELQAMKEHAVAIRHMAERFATAKDGTPAQEVYNLITNPPGVRTEASILLSQIARDHSLNNRQLAAQLGVSEVVLVGMVENALNDESIGDLLADVSEFIRSQPFLERQQALDEGDKDALADILQSTRAEERSIRLERRKAVKDAQRQQVLLVTMDKAKAVFDNVSQSEGFKALESLLENPPTQDDSGAFRMVEYDGNGHFLHDFKAAGIEQERVSMVAELAATEAKLWFKRLQDWADNATLYVQKWHAVNEAIAAGQDVSLESQGIDPRVARGLMDAMSYDIPMLLNVYDLKSNQSYGKVPAFFSTMVDPALFGGFFHKVFAQPERVLRHLNTPSSKLLSSAIRDSSRADRVIDRTRNRHSDMRRVISEASDSHNKDWDLKTYREQVFDHMATMARMTGSPVKVDYTLPNGHKVTKADIKLLRELEAVYSDLMEGFGPRVTRGIEERIGNRTLVRKARPVGDFSVNRKQDFVRSKLFRDSLLTHYSDGRAQDMAGVITLLEKDNVGLEDGSYMERFWDMNPETLLSHIMDSRLPDADREVAVHKDFRQLQQEWVQEALDGGRFSELNSGLTVNQLVSELVTRAAQTKGFTTQFDPATVRRLLTAELKPYMRRIADRMRSPEAINSSTHVKFELESAENMFTRPANKLELPSVMYTYGALDDTQLHQFFAAPRVTSDTRLLNLMESTVKEAKAMIEADQIPKGVRDARQFEKLINAAARVAKDFEEQHHQKPDVQRLMGTDASPSGVRLDVTSVMHTLVLTPASVTVGNTFLAPFAFFAYEIRRGEVMRAFYSALAASVALPFHFSGAMVQAVGTAIGKAADRVGLGKLFAKEGGKRLAENLLSTIANRIYGKLAASITQAPNKLKDLGVIHRPKLTDTWHENARSFREQARGSVAGAFVDLTKIGLKDVLAVGTKIGIEFGDRLINEVGLTFAQARLEELADWAYKYGRSRERLFPGQEYRPDAPGWNMPDGKLLGLNSDQLAEARSFHERLGTPFEQLLWDLYQYDKAVEAGLDDLALQPDESNPEVIARHNQLKAKINDYLDRITVMIVEDLNAPGRFNRSLAPRIDRFYRFISPLQGYTGNLAMDLLETIQGKSTDDDWMQAFGRFLYSVLALLIGATMQGIISATARENVKRAVGRSSGQAVLTDDDFYRDLEVAAYNISEGEFKMALRNAQPLALGAASALPYVGDLGLLAMDQMAMAPSRGHLLDFSNRSLVLQFATQAVTGVTGTLLSAAQGQGKAAAAQSFDDFAYRWLPYYDLTVHKLGDAHGGAREKFMNTLALSREAALEGTVEPRRFSFSGNTFRTALTVLKRRVGNAASSRDRGELRDAFDDMVDYYREQGREKRSYREAKRLAIGAVERLAPTSRAVRHRSVSRGESRRLLRGVTGVRRGRIDEAIDDYKWAAGILGADLSPEVRSR